MEILIISMFVSFLTTFFVTPLLMRFLYFANIVGIDLHKKGKPKLPASGGICVASGVLAGLLSYIGMQTFFYGSSAVSIYLLAVISSILIVTFGGFLDDLNVKSRLVDTKDGKNIKIGFPQWLKPLLTLPAAVPLMVVSAGVTTMLIPFVGLVNFGILYPLFLIPFIVVAISNMVNLLGGFNGMESGMAIVYCLSLGIYGLLYSGIASVIFLITVAALVGFIRYNWYPAKILPGDSLTYLLGAIVASGIVVGNIERAGIVVMTPFIIEFFLKLRSRLKATSLGRLRPDGRLEPPYGKKIYSLTHVVMNLRAMKEKDVAVAFIVLQILFGLIAVSNLV